MGVLRLAEATWEEVRALDGSRAVALLPVGAIEAHGPHLPLATDVIIAEEMARRAAAELANRGFDAVLLPPLAYTVAEFAGNFAGTLSVRPETLACVLRDLCASVARAGIRDLVIVNGHLDPGHLAVLRALEAHPLRVHFMDKTRRANAEKLGDEFRSGSCHAGRYETSLVLAARPESVRDAARALPGVFVPLHEKIRQGATRFEEIGMDRAYCGFPAEASREEGERLYETLCGLIVDQFLQSRSR